MLTFVSWLNEGWTMYLERRIQSEIHGAAEFDFSAIIGWQSLGRCLHRRTQMDTEHAQRMPWRFSERTTNTPN